jgi:hypothetical protein
MSEYAKKATKKMPAPEAEAGSLIASQLDNQRRERTPVGNNRMPRLKLVCASHRE